MGNICKDCCGDMGKVNGCVEKTYLLIDGKKVKPIKAGDKGDWVELPGTCCTDCGTDHGYCHHLGCDVERCGNCGGQLITCDCEYSAEFIIHGGKSD